MEALGRTLREDLARHEETGRFRDASLRKHVLQAFDDRRPVRRRWAPLALTCAVLAAGIGLAVLLWPRIVHPPLRFWIEDRSGEVDEWVTARDVAQSLRFSDGSSIVVGSQTTARIMQVTERGARLTLERGRLDAHVIHQEASRWQVAAGPFLVKVTGTRFRVGWEPFAETLSVSVSEGQVEVTGGGHPKHQLAAGSGLELRVTTQGQAGVSAEAQPAAAPELTAATTARAPASSAAARLEPSAERATDWRALATGGRYREALAAVEEQGFSSQCGLLSARDLLSLASAARLAGNAGRANEAYFAARARYPRSTEAALSAFSLGRLASDGGRVLEASRWFKQYLAEEPSGELAREASGRLIELARKTGDQQQARSASDSYLRLYPAGPHATLARSILSRP